MIDRQDFEQIERLSQAEFKLHALGPMDGGNDVFMWRCGRPGRGLYHFRVIVWPGHVAVYGDVGQLTLSISDKNPLPWLQKAVGSPEYLLSKSVHAYERFERDAAVRFAKSVYDEKTFGKIAGLGDDLNEFTWHEAAGFDQSLPTFATSDALWSYFALKWFVERLAKGSPEAFERGTK